MASNKRTIYLGLDYSDFTGGITEVNRKMGLLDAEFKLAQEQAKNYGNETDTLGVKQDYLSQKIALQKQKVEEAKKAYDSALSSQNASEKQIDTLDKKLLQERTALEKLEGQLKDTDKQQENLNKNTESFGDAIRGLASDLGISISPAIEKLASKFDGISKATGTAIVGIASIVTGLVSCTKAAAATADELNTLSSVTGFSTDELQKLQYASDFVDVSLDTMTSSLKKLTSNMDKAKKGSGESAEAFRKLKVKVTDSHGALRDSNDVFYQVIDALGKIKNETERDALAMQVFGKSASELNPLIEAGSERLKELGIEAENLGVVMSGEDLGALNELQDSFDRFENTTDSLKNSLGLVLLPILSDVFETISKIPTPVLKNLTILASVVASILLVVKAIKSVTSTASSITSFFSTTNAATLKTTAIVLGVVAALIALATVIAVIIGKTSEVKEAMNSVSGSVSTVQASVTSASNYKVKNNASGTDNFEGGRTWVGEDGPELVTLPRGSRISPASEVGSVEYNTFNITIDAQSVDDFQRVYQLAKNRKNALRRI